MADLASFRVSLWNSREIWPSFSFPGPLVASTLSKSSLIVDGNISPWWELISLPGENWWTLSHPEVTRLPDILHSSHCPSFFRDLVSTALTPPMNFWDFCQLCCYLSNVLSTQNFPVISTYLRVKEQVLIQKEQPSTVRKLKYIPTTFK